MKRAIIAVLTIALMVGGCIVTGNLIILIGIGDLKANATQTFASEYVDLNDYSDYVDHKDDLNSVDDMGFVCRIYNSGSSLATGKLWVSPTESNAKLPSDAVLALDGLVVKPGETREITLSESYDYLKNFKQVRKIVLDEKFTAYFTSATTPFTLQVKDLVLVLSINGKP
jgi:hypothetical protein